METKADRREYLAGIPPCLFVPLSREDRDEIQAKGVAAAFGPGSEADEIVQQICSLAEARGAA